MIRRHTSVIFQISHYYSIANGLRSNQNPIKRGNITFVLLTFNSSTNYKILKYYSNKLQHIFNIYLKNLQSYKSRD